MGRRNRIAPLVALIIAGVFTTPAAAQEYRFTIHHFLSPKAITHTKFLVPWAERVTKASGGRLRFEIFPSMTLGGKPPELYAQVRDGVADLVWTLPGYTPGVFPRLEVFELVGVHGGSARATTAAIQELMPKLEPDLAAVKPILVHVHAGNALHLATREVTSIADVSGLKLRSPSRTGVWMLEAWGAEPVGMPVPALPQALAKNTIDGALIPFEVAVPLKIAELTTSSIELEGGRRFGTSVFLFAMNKERYDALPVDLKAVINAHSGLAIADEIATAWDAAEPTGKEVARARGNAVVALSAGASAAFDAKSELVAKRWLDDVNGRGIDGAALLAAAKSAIAKHTGAE